MNARDRDDRLHATILFEKSRGRVGADRIDLLRAIAATGSISAAARSVGLSYKAAWDAVQVLNNLFELPLVVPSAGGNAGGATVVTAAGSAAIAAFTAAEVELAALTARLATALSNDHAAMLKPLLWGIALKTSARNALRGTVTRVVSGAVDAEVVLDVGGGVEIVSVITRESVDDLGLAPGVAAIALIKASFVVLARGDDSLRTSARNNISGVVARREDGTVNSEVTIEVAAGKTITATLTRESADALELDVGAPASAMIKASHVILAVA